MRTIPTLAATLAMTCGVFAAEPHKGEITKVDMAAAKLSMTHGPIPKLDMEGGMTMAYHVKDKAMLNGLKPGDHVKFDADQIDGVYTITSIRR